MTNIFNNILDKYKSIALSSSGVPNLKDGSSNMNYQSKVEKGNNGVRHRKLPPSQLAYLEKQRLAQENFVQRWVRNITIYCQNLNPFKTS